MASLGIKPVPPTVNETAIVLKDLLDFVRAEAINYNTDLRVGKARRFLIELDRQQRNKNGAKTLTAKERI